MEPGYGLVPPGLGLGLHDDCEVSEAFHSRYAKPFELGYQLDAVKPSSWCRFRDRNGVYGRHHRRVAARHIILDRL